MFSSLRIKAVMKKEFYQIKRDIMTLKMIIMIPLIQLLLFGYAINADVRDISIGVVDNTNSIIGRMVLESVEATQVISVKKKYNTVSEAEADLRTNKIKAIFVLPHDIEKRVQESKEVGQWIVDGTDTAISTSLSGLAYMPLNSVKLLSSEVHKTFELTLLYNPNKRAEVNVVPGLLGVILTMTMILFTSATIVKEKEKGNLELLINTPIKPIELMLGKIIPYMFIGLIQVFIILSLGYYVFKVPINGSLFQVFLSSLLFISASLTIGLIISNIAKTQLQAMQLTIFILLPSILLSGFMFPYEGMPPIAQNISEFIPATHFMRIIRAVILKEATLFELWKDVFWLALFTVFGLMIAVTTFKKRLE